MHLPHAAGTQEKKVSELLSSLKGNLVHFLCNIGNAGDGLIHAGFYQMAAAAGLALDSFYYPEPRSGEILLIMGAGCFCSRSWNMVDAVSYYSGRYDQIYILPASFETTFAPVAKLMRELPANVTVFCRERESFAQVSRIVPRPGSIFLDHDLAFALEVSSPAEKGYDSLYAFRTDNESRYHLLPSPNYDLSAMGREYHHRLLLDIIANFAEIHTDRLHIGIAGALLGKRVHLFPNSYHKIEAVYKYSLQRYPQVSLGDEAALRQLVKKSRGNEMLEKLRAQAIRLPKARPALRILKQMVRRIPKAKQQTERVAADKRS